ncbi:hypothetical protein [Erwinia sp. SLM-02]|uniref:hypothetical protein n=1 Tax=Erwinia sp. SLM-02 TaxID=3020057 RepID=UPI0028D79A09|nr:hypothetical protein [uncultured Erwinia sp.]
MKQQSGMKTPASKKNKRDPFRMKNIVLLSLLPLFSYAQDGMTDSSVLSVSEVDSLTQRAMQPDGYAVAAAMNRRYFDTQDTCGSQPAYYCNGVMIRAANGKSKYHAWDPSPSSVSRGGVAFSYFRTDLSAVRLQENRSQGFSIKNNNSRATTDYPLEVACSFPYDAGTESRIDRGCGMYLSDRASRACDQQGITTAQQWLTHFNSVANSGDLRYMHQCSFSGDTTPFATSLEARRISRPDTQNIRWSQNELALKTWPVGTSQTLPVESFFYAVGNNQADGLSGAQYMQQDFYQQTGIVVPVVRLNLANNVKEVFSFRQEDQKVNVDNNQNNGISALKPTAVSATGNGGSLLTKDDYYRLDALPVEVPAYVNMAKGDNVTLRWIGREHTWSSPSQIVTAPGKLRFNVPRTEFIDTIGSSATIAFSVQRAGASGLETSGSLSLAVEDQALRLTKPVISGDFKKVTASFAGMNTSQNVRLRWMGVTTRNAIPVKANSSGSVTIDIPDAWIKENNGREVEILYSVGDSYGAKYQFSQVLRIVL